jgi:branched-chain amino acid transport system ATP-binding protein
MTPLLELEGVTARYGPIQALHGISLSVEEGEIAAVLGANGAGKTTTLRAISGSVRRDGELRFAGKKLGRAGPDTVARLGVAHVPEGRGTFAELTVWENLRLGAYTRRASKDDFARIQTYFRWLGERRHQQAGTLSGGEQQMLAVGRALMSRPKVLMLDEPTTGLAPKLARSAFAALEGLKGKGLTLLIAEQQVPLALSVADRGYVLENGRIRLEGSPEELEANPEVRRAYLGIA